MEIKWKVEQHSWIKYEQPKQNGNVRELFEFIIDIIKLIISNN